MLNFVSYSFWHGSQQKACQTVLTTVKYVLGNVKNNLGFYSNSVINKLQVKLAERLGKLSGYEDYQFFLINSCRHLT